MTRRATVPALDPVVAWRVVAMPAALDAARWRGDPVDVLRIAPDEALGIGATGVDVDDPDAIVQPEAGFSSARLTEGELRDVSAHIEWEVPGAAQGRIIAQGKIAGVPAKLVLADPPRLVVQTCYVLDLRTRLGW
jgi:hypothetical protein